MFDHLHYVPILKWRQGEYQALLNLTPQIKEWTTPLFEIPKETWDFEKEAPSKSLTQHLEKFGKRLKAKWGNKACFVDSCYIAGDARVDAGSHHFTWIFDLAREEGCKPIPVVGLNRHPSYLAAVQSIIASDARGVCVRLLSEDFDRAGFKVDLQTILQTLGVKPPETDIIIDLQANVAHSSSAHARVVQSMLQQLPLLARWRTLTIAGTSFPQNLPSSEFRPAGFAPRYEWLGYKKLIETMPENIRVPTFADYSVSHPNTDLLDPRLVDPLAKIKYAIDNDWFIVLGTQVKRNGRGQYAELCRSIVNRTPEVFGGESYSWGDHYIHGCAYNIETTGGASTWPSVATNRHVTRTVRGVATLYAASISP